MKHCLSLLSLIALAGLSATVSAETLLIDRVHEPASNLPVRGLTGAQVQAKYGVPQQRLDPRGGQKRQWPTINRWVYPEFTVYFEKNKVIDVVANKASPDEIGPKPPIR
ncbi:hypothetical protein [Pseudoxanthomonas sp. JBR18]|uniref:hypothetical protein n=1 Tax=Pseudoxanthomonas sp. JBR18 TaxID=2969308 RepID=UPI00230611F0|nr:hypothetical protein [Pseudoxanthomonas sp. JBR18]WCE03945.1 hypothetical protein PJ250_17985 [Pseudoxanthomonas sp. JBR18]